MKYFSRVARQGESLSRRVGFVFNIILLSLLWVTNGGAESDRISSMNKDLGRAERITLAPGLVSVVEFPSAITEVRVGHPGVLKAQISSVSPRELTLYLSGASEVPTNIVVRAERRVFVFDIVPSRVSHQDYVKVRGAFGGPTLSSQFARTVAFAPIAPRSASKSKFTGQIIHSKGIGGGP